MVIISLYLTNLTENGFFLIYVSDTVKPVNFSSFLGLFLSKMLFGIDLHVLELLMVEVFVYELGFLAHGFLTSLDKGLYVWQAESALGSSFHCWAETMQVLMFLKGSFEEHILRDINYL